MLELHLGLGMDLNNRPYNELVWFIETRQRLDEAQSSITA